MAEEKERLMEQGMVRRFDGDDDNDDEDNNPKLNVPSNVPR